MSWDSKIKATATDLTSKARHGVDRLGKTMSKPRSTRRGGNDTGTKARAVVSN
jgi:hypothetical protein